MANIGERGNRHACAACKHQRKKCREDCILSLYFPADRSEEFQIIHKIFGVSNVSKILQSIDNDRDREEAVKSIRWEALMWEKDPVHGPLGAYKKLERELERLKNQINRQISGKSISPYLTNSGLIDISTIPRRETGIIPNNDDAITAMFYSNTHQNNIMRREDKNGQALDYVVPAPRPPYVTMSAQEQERVSQGSGIVISERPLVALSEPLGRGQLVGCSSSIINPVEQNQGVLRASRGRGYVAPLYNTHCDQQQRINYHGNYRGGYDIPASYAPPPPSVEGVGQLRGYPPYQYNNFIGRPDIGQTYDGLVQQRRQLYAERNTNHGQAIQ